MVCSDFDNPQLLLHLVADYEGSQVSIISHRVNDDFHFIGNGNQLQGNLEGHIIPADRLNVPYQNLEALDCLNNLCRMRHDCNSL